MNQQSQPPVQQGQPPVSKGLLVVLIIVVLIGAAFAVWYFLMGPGKAVKATTTTTTTTPAATTTTTPSTTTTTTTPATTATADWKTYTNTTNKFSVKYPTTWSTQEKTTDSRVLFRNDNLTTNYDKSNTPASYESLFVAYSDTDCSVAQEAVDTAGGSEKTSVTNPTITNNAVTMKAYQYSSSDGPYISAYWQNTAGKRFCAFAYTRTDETVKTENISVFKNLLSTFAFTK